MLSQNLSLTPNTTSTTTTSSLHPQLNTEQALGHVGYPKMQRVHLLLGEGLVHVAVHNAVTVAGAV